jgi:CBS domain-containing protein
MGIDVQAILRRVVFPDRKQLSRRRTLPMRVQELMVKDVKVCSPTTNLAAVAEILWKAGCGTVPVVENGRVLSQS